MSVKTRITAISISKETEKHLKNLQEKSGKGRSQLIRDLINSTAKPAATPKKSPEMYFHQSDLDDPNTILKKYFKLISGQSSKPTLVIGVAIINKKDRVLIGLRKKTDPYIKNLSWTFPSGKFTTLNFASELAKTVVHETGFEIKVLPLIHARIIPDSPGKRIQIIALYYHCRILSGKISPGGNFKELKWIPAADVTRYFTTSTSDEIMNFLGRL